MGGISNTGTGCERNWEGWLFLRLQLINGEHEFAHF